MYVRLGIEADQVERGRLLGAVGAQAEHHRPDLAPANVARLVERDRERLPGVLERRDVREQGARVEEHRVPGRRGADQGTASSR